MPEPGSVSFILRISQAIVMILPMKTRDIRTKAAYSKANLPRAYFLTVHSDWESLRENCMKPLMLTLDVRAIARQIAIQEALTVKGVSALLQNLRMLKHDVLKDPRKLLDAP